MQRLSCLTLDHLPAAVSRPNFDPTALKTGLVHLGLGAFHRAHQAVFTEDAIAARGGNWGIVGASLQHATTPDRLAAQHGLYTVETLDKTASYRVLGVVRQALFAPRDRMTLLKALTAPTTHAVTVTLSEKGYCLDVSGALDVKRPEIASDLAAPDRPRSAIGWLALALARRHKTGAGPLTIFSCDNLQANGSRLSRAVTEFVDRTSPELCSGIVAHNAFPSSIVDCIVPASDVAHGSRVMRALELSDEVSVQREPYAQWVMEDRFAGPLPAWDVAGAEIVEDISDFQRLKLHILNTAHSALAYLGLPRGHHSVRQAIADLELSNFLEKLVENELAPALAPLDGVGYWRKVKARFQNPMIDHRLAQIAEDGSLKLPQRLFPLLIDNSQKGRAIIGMATIVRAWLALMATSPSRDPAQHWWAAWSHDGADIAVALDNEALFPPPFRTTLRLRSSIIGA